MLREDSVHGCEDAGQSEGLTFVTAQGENETL